MRIFKACMWSVFLGTLSVPAMAAQLVVVGVEGKAPVGLGDIVESASPITIPEGAVLTFINASGLKLKITGPHKGPLGSKKAAASTGAGGSAKGAGLNMGFDVVKSLAGLFKNQMNSKKLGAFRSAPARIPGPWMYDVASAGSYCIGGGQKARLWRHSARKKMIVTLAPEGGGKSKTVVWKKGLDTLSWPSAVALKGGAKYTARIGKKGKQQPVTVHMLPSDLPTRAHQAAWMAERGCEDQARILIVTANVDKMIRDLEKAGQF